MSDTGDCGGIPGFYNLLEAISAPEHEQHEELLEWLGDDFDPEAFAADEVNRRFASLQRRRNKAAGCKEMSQVPSSGNRRSVPYAGLPKPPAFQSYVVSVAKSVSY